MTDWAMGKLWETASQNNYNSLQISSLCYSGSTLPIGTNPLFPLILRGTKHDKALKYNSLQGFLKSLHFENGGFCYGRTMGKAILGSIQKWIGPFCVCVGKNFNERNFMTQKYYGTKLIEAWEAKGGKDNLEDGHGVKYEDGYMSWSPKEVFEKAYQPLTAMSFGHAIEALKAGQKVCRAGWNGKGMFLLLIPDLQGRLEIKISDTKICDWLPVASQTDMLANDWQVVTD